ncbi:MAG TPA: 30S ribosomal protein S5 [Candidatus Syntrophoarchaeum butanivorans]|uniref:Small ribosomal subunit protein uS5 n=1 Tax=Candidatus Syntropharchaeum butanivorans TaxID=1839936 RepID=A0A7C0X129_9EURY|nr:MAG: 30S ribosomal protein S5 [Candidatus Syntrophoarchaeum sp. WYZ-LMO15]HDM36775.1 30S ribosomal protein S5 [Candidatus Syntrophoarchaeum butanivorans]
MAQGKRGRSRVEGNRLSKVDLSDWVPKTKLGKMVHSGKIDNIDDALRSGLPIRESEIIDALLPDLREEVLDINMVQRMTDSGRRVKFRVCVVVGNEDGYVGVGQTKDLQVGPAIGKAAKVAKLNLIKIRRGCGSWECGCGLEHTVPFEVRGKSGSVEIVLKPAPRGLGLVCGETPRKVLRLAGIEDVWTRSEGQQRTTLNFAMATFNALKSTVTMKV